MTTPVQNDVTPFNQYTATGGQVTFPYTFLIYQASDINVFQKGANSTPDDAEQLLELGVDYTLTGIGDDSGGNVVLTTGATLNDIITASRSTSLARQTEFVPGNLTPDSLNLEFNNLLAMVQDIVMQIKKIIPNYNFSGIFSQVNMKLPQLGANEIWQMNSVATGIQTVQLVETDPGAIILRSDLASHAEGKGASLVGLTDGQTVQQFADSLEDNVIYGLDVSDSPDAVKVNFSPAITEYKEGAIYLVRFANNGTGAATANFDALGYLPLRYPAGYELQEGDILANKVGIITYVQNDEGPYFQLLNPDFEGQIAAAGIRKAYTAKAYLSVSQTISVTTPTKVEFDSIEFDDNSFWDDENKYFVLNKLGKFRISAALQAGVNLELNMYLYVNGAIYELLNGQDFSYAGHGSLYGGTIYENTDTDNYAEIFVVSSGTSSTIAAGITGPKFSIEYLGENVEEEEEEEEEEAKE